MEEQRNNLTSLPYREWASKLATSFELASTRATNKFLKDWYLEQAIGLWNSILRRNMSNYGISPNCERQAEFSLDDSLYERIEMEFAIPVYVTMEQSSRLHELFNEICDNPANKPVDGVHWASGYGAKPTWSQADASLLGKTAEPGAPLTGEPEWDEMTLHFESSVKKQ